MSCPLVSIVIPTYNRANDLERALTSVFAQTYSNWEILVIDNYSTDNTDDILSNINDKRLKVIKIRNNGVVAKSRNHGINMANGKYIAFLDSDDWWKSKKLSESIKVLNQGYDIVYHDLYLVSEYNQLFYFRRARSRILKKPIYDDLIQHGNTLFNSSVVINKHILGKINGFSEKKEFIAVEDYDGWLKVAKITEKFYKLNNTLGYYWIGGGNLSSPRRTIETLDALALVYPDLVINPKGQNKHYIYNYTKGRMYYKLNNYSESNKYLNQINIKQSPYLIYLKCFWMLISIRFLKFTFKI